MNKVEKNMPIRTALLPAFILTFLAAGPVHAGEYRTHPWTEIDSFKFESLYNPILQRKLDSEGPLPELNVSKAKIRVNQPDGPGPFPAVLIHHGCDGLNAVNQFWHRWHAERGFVSVLVDSFGPRRIKSVCKKATYGARVMAHRVADAYAALDHLVSNREKYRVDAGKIFVSGGSNGGFVTKLAMKRQTLAAVRGHLKHPYRFAGGIMFYTHCNEPARPEFYNPTIHIIGERDDWTLPEPCIEWEKSADKLEGSAPFALHLIPRATHGFDNPDARNGGYSLGHFIRYDAPAVDRAEKIITAYFSGAEVRNASGLVPLEQAFLAPEESRTRLAGNTAVMPAPNGAIIRRYFGEQGLSELSADRAPGRIFRRKWWIDEAGQLCFDGVRQDRQTCSKFAVLDGKLHLQPSGAPKTAAFDLLPGRHLPAGGGPEAGPLIIPPDELRRMLAGNTIRMAVPSNGRQVTIYLHPDGAADVAFANSPGRKVRQRWSINDKGRFCRHLPNGRNPCLRVLRNGAEPPAGHAGVTSALTMVNNRRQAAGAWVLKGDHTSGEALAAAPPDYPAAALPERPGFASGMGPGGGPANGPGAGRQGGPGPAMAGRRSTAQMADRIFQRMDRDKDGVITRDEFLAVRKNAGKAFDNKLDRNRDGRLTKQEFLDATAQ